MIKYKNSNTAYVIGVAIGDGNLSNSNGRAVRLRITCDNKYPNIQTRIITSLKILLPNNKTSIYKRERNCTDIYCHSNKLENILGWKALGGSKYKQKVRIPTWIFEKKIWIKNCLRGLIETDGSIYKDRAYTYINFTTIIRVLAEDVQLLISKLGFTSTLQSSMQISGKRKYVIRVCKNSLNFIKEVGINKS